MASLQTLRNKGGVIVAVIIGIALLAFILGDMLTSGSVLFGNSANNVGEINGKDVTAVEYGNQINYLTEIQKISSGTETVSEEQSQAIQIQAWEQMVRKYAVDPQLSQAGITVTSAEMKELISGRYLSPIVQQIFANPQTGQFDAVYLRQFVENLDKDQSGRMQMFWDYLQSEVQAQAQILKYKTLIDKSIYVTGMESNLMASLESNTYGVQFVAENYSAIADSTIAVSEAELKTFYDKNKAMFDRQLSRSIDFVVFEALPSPADYTAAEKYVTELTGEFEASQNVKQFVTLNSQDPFDSRYYKEGELTGELGAFAFNTTGQTIYGPVLSGDQYTLARVSDVQIVPDSINFSHIVIAPDNKKLADSLAAVLPSASAEDWAKAAATYSLDTQTGATAGLVGTLDPQTLSTEFAEPLYKTPKGSITTVATANGIHIIKVNNRIGESSKVQLGKITYKVEASKDTRNATFAKATDFNKSIDALGFQKAVTAASAAKRSVVVNSTDRAIQGLNSSRELVRWTYNAKKDDKSTIMEFGDNFVIATLTTITDKGIAPLDAVREQATTMIRREKKGEMLSKKMAGAASLEALASTLSKTVINAPEVNFNTFIAPEVGYDPAFAGGICGIKDSLTLSKPIVGVSGVYVAKITSTVATPVAQGVEAQKIAAEREQNVFVSAYQTLLERSNIVDERYKFY
ncbi:MAG: peptidylprolyl isomerase [Mucinivorans sp.]